MQLSEKLKKILFIIGFTLLVGIMGVGLYFLWFAPPPSDVEYVNVNGTLIPWDQLPNINQGGVKPIVSNVNTTPNLPEVTPTASGGKTLVTQVGSADVQDIALGTNGQNIVYYNSADGKFYMIDAQGNVIALTDDVFKNVENVTWGTSKDKAVLEFPDGSNIFYDFNKDQQYTLPPEMEDFTFSPSDAEIGFKYITENEKDRWLGVASPDGSNAMGLEQLGANGDKVDVDWSPSGTVVATFYEFINGTQQEINLVGLKGENFKNFIAEGQDFRGAWSPDGSKLLYSVFNAENDYKPTLYITDASGEKIGQNHIALNLNTWSDKCAFNGKSTVYCAVPTSLDRGAGFSKESTYGTPDEIYKIDVNSGVKTLIAIPSNSQGINNYSIEQLSVSNDGSTLFFKDSQSKKLNKLLLK